MKQWIKAINANDYDNTIRLLAVARKFVIISALVRLMVFAKEISVLDFISSEFGYQIGMLLLINSIETVLLIFSVGFVLWALTKTQESIRLARTNG